MAKRQVFFSFHYANPTLTAKREYYGIGEVMIAFGIKFSIDSGCRGMSCLKPRHRNLLDTMRKISTPARWRR